MRQKTSRVKTNATFLGETTRVIKGLLFSMSRSRSGRRLPRSTRKYFNHPKNRRAWPYSPRIATTCQPLFFTLTLRLGRFQESASAPNFSGFLVFLELGQEASCKEVRLIKTRSRRQYQQGRFPYTNAGDSPYEEESDPGRLVSAEKTKQE